LDQSNSTIEDLQNQALKAQSEIDDKQSRLDALQGDVERLTQTLDEANAKAENANADRDKLQTKFDQANRKLTSSKANLRKLRRSRARVSTLTRGLATHSGERSEEQPVRLCVRRCSPKGILRFLRDVGFWQMLSIKAATSGALAIIDSDGRAIESKLRARLFP
jgi:septal ring factor EnvC (AmiA/AmiB activator)